MKPHIRWMIRRDMPAVLAIENESFEFPWPEETFVHYLRKRNAIGMVAENLADDCIMGFMVYELHKCKLDLAGFAVGAEYRHQGIGKAMLDKLKIKLSRQRRNRITLLVRESNLDAQLFFRSQGFRAVSVVKDNYEETPEDAYLFQYRYVEPRAVVVPVDDAARAIT